MFAIYLLRKPTLVLETTDVRRTLVTLDAGVRLRVREAQRGERDVECVVGRRKFLIFRVDLEDRAERLPASGDPNSVGYPEEDADCGRRKVRNTTATLADAPSMGGVGPDGPDCATD